MRLSDFHNPLEKPLPSLSVAPKISTNDIINIQNMNKDNSLNKRAGGTPGRDADLFGQVRQKIVAIRGSQVILDADVAELYGVETMRVNEAVKNNPDKFPEGYIMTLTKEEKEKVIEIFDNPKLKYSPVMPKAFTEKGLYMLATILKSRRATQATIAIIETFASVRQLKRELRALHEEKDKEMQQSRMHHFGEMLSNIVMPDLETSETESSLEINFLVGKIKHTVRRVRRQDGNDSTEVE